MKPLLVLLAVVLFDGPCHPPPDVVRIEWLSFLNAAREVRDGGGVEAALPLYRRAAAGDAPHEAGWAAVTLWDYHEARGDSAEAAAYRETALVHLGDDAWTFWASSSGRARGVTDSYAPEHLAGVFERLHVGIGSGSEAAAAELTRRLQVLEMESAQGNEAARELLALVRARGLDGRRLS